MRWGSSTTWMSKSTSAWPGSTASPAGGLLDKRILRRIAAGMRDSLSIKMQNVDAPIRSLSGGNQQKVLISRWLALKPSILVMNEPTRGVDVGAKQEITELILRLAGRRVHLRDLLLRAWRSCWP